LKSIREQGRVQERRRAAALARHYRDQEGLSIAEIARRLGRAKATVKAYLYDPSGDKAREVKARYRGACRGCGAPTAPRNGKGDACAYCKRCHPGESRRNGHRNGFAKPCAHGGLGFCIHPNAVMKFADGAERLLPLHALGPAEQKRGTDVRAVTRQKQAPAAVAGACISICRQL